MPYFAVSIIINAECRMPNIIQTEIPEGKKNLTLFIKCYLVLHMAVILLHLAILYIVKWRCNKKELKKNAIPCNDAWYPKLLYIMMVKQGYMFSWESHVFKPVEYLVASYSLSSLCSQTWAKKGGQDNIRRALLFVS
jgi:hypothetical protein